MKRNNYQHSHTTIIYLMIIEPKRQMSSSHAISIFLSTIDKLSRTVIFIRGYNVTELYTQTLLPGKVEKPEIKGSQGGRCKGLDY